MVDNPNKSPLSHSKEKFNYSNRLFHDKKHNNILKKYLLNFKKHESRNERHFFEHDNRNSNYNNIRSSISALNVESDRLELVRGQNISRCRQMRRPTNTEHNRKTGNARFGPQSIYTPNMNRFKKKLLRKQNKLRKQLDALQIQSKFANMITSSCCCKCNWLSINDANVCSNTLIKQQNPTKQSHGKLSGISESTVCAESTLQSVIRYNVGMQIND